MISIFQTSQKLNPYHQFSTSIQKQLFTNLPHLDQYLQTVKINIHHFLDSLKSNQKEPLQLGEDIQELNDYEYIGLIDSQTIMALIDNSIRRMMINKRIKKNWSKSDLIILLYIIEKYNLKQKKITGDYKQEDWNFIASHIPGKNSLQCMFKWLNLKKNKINQFPWTLQQQSELSKLVLLKGTNKWNQISQLLYLNSHNSIKIFRSPKQCREHWTFYLDLQIKKGPWSQQQDYQLLSNFLRLGKKWSQISKILHGRTQNAVKNRFNLIMQKQKKSDRKNVFSWQDYAKQIIQKIDNCRLIKQRIDKVADQKIVQLKEYEMEDQLLNESIKKKNIFNQSVNVSQKQNVRLIRFERISLQQLMNLDGFVPAIFNRQTMQIVCKNNQNKKIQEELFKKNIKNTLKKQNIL